MRRGGVSYKDKFTVKNPANALIGNGSYGPIFGTGSGHDILICNQSNTTMGSKSDFGTSYNLPNGFTYGGNAREFLAGHLNQWTTTEIEVYQIV